MSQSPAKTAVEYRAELVAKQQAREAEEARIWMERIREEARLKAQLEEEEEEELKRIEEEEKVERERRKRKGEKRRSREGGGIGREGEELEEG